MNNVKFYRRDKTTGNIQVALVKIAKCRGKSLWMKKDVTSELGESFANTRQVSVLKYPTLFSAVQQMGAKGWFRNKTGAP